MPNHVKNKMTISGNPESIDRLLAKVTTSESQFDFNGIIPMPDDIFKGNLGYEERRMYGAKNWYDWSWDNWGTKWNAYEITVERDYDDQLRVEFLTAWSEPEPIFYALNEQYPDLDIYVEFANEDLGRDCGVFQNGDLIYYDDNENAFEYAADIWEYTEEEIAEMKAE